MWRRVGEWGVWLFDWYLRLEWLGKLILALGFGVGVVTSVGTFLTTVAQGFTPLLAIFFALFAVLLVFVSVLLAMEVTGTRIPPKRNHARTSPQASLSLRVYRAIDRVPVRQALYWALKRQWPSPSDELPTALSAGADLALERMRGLASEGKLTIWGKVSPQHAIVAIVPGFWITNKIDYVSVADRAGPTKTEQAVFQSHREIYIDLYIDKKQMEEFWPLN